MRATASAVPRRRFAFSARRTSGSLVTGAVPSSAASCGHRRGNPAIVVDGARGVGDDRRVRVGEEARDAGVPQAAQCDDGCSCGRPWTRATRAPRAPPCRRCVARAAAAAVLQPLVAPVVGGQHRDDGRGRGTIGEATESLGGEEARRAVRRPAAAAAAGRRPVRTARRRSGARPARESRRRRRRGRPAAPRPASARGGRVARRPTGRAAGRAGSSDRARRRAAPARRRAARGRTAPSAARACRHAAAAAPRPRRDAARSRRAAGPAPPCGSRCRPSAGVSSFQSRPLFFESQPVIQSVRYSAPSGPNFMPTTSTPLVRTFSSAFLKPAPSGAQREAVDARIGRGAGEARHEEVVLPGVREGGAGVVDHARRTGVPVLDRREHVRGLVLGARLEERLAHPDVVAVVLRVGVLAVLPVRPPAAVGAVGQVDEAFLLAGVVAVVVDRDQVAAVVERELLQVADAGGEDLEVRAVEFRPHHRALVRHAPRLAGLVHHVQADVADLPVEPPVGADRHAGHAVAAEGRDAC